jgi:hypothetical protein
MKKWIIGILIALVSYGSIAFAASDRYIVEQYLTELAQETLNSMFGKGNFIARVQVQMTESQYSVKYTQESSPKKSSAKKDTEEVFILPGVPALKNLNPSAMNQLPYDSVTSMVAPRIKRLSVYILGNRNYPKAQANKAETAVKEILSFREGRDIFKVEYKPFYEDPTAEAQKMTLIPGPEKLVSFQNLFYALILTLLLVMICTYIILQRKLINKMGIDESGGGTGTKH